MHSHCFCGLKQFLVMLFSQSFLIVFIISTILIITVDTMSHNKGKVYIFKTPYTVHNCFAVQQVQYCTQDVCVHFYSYKDYPGRLFIHSLLPPRSWNAICMLQAAMYIFAYYRVYSTVSTMHIPDCHVIFLECHFLYFVSVSYLLDLVQILHH